MKCPIDNETLVMTDRHGVEIDYCPKCRGVWLDRGELDKIIELSVPQAQTRPMQRVTTQHYDTSHKHRKKKKDSLLSELFDF